MDRYGEIYNYVHILVSIHTYTSKLGPLRGHRNNDTQLSPRSWFLNTILFRKLVDSRTEEGKCRMSLEHFMVLGSKKKVLKK